MRTSDKILLVGLTIIDRLFATNFVERNIARRKANVARYEARLAEISAQLAKIEGLLEAANLQLCLLYLRQRELLSPHRWLHFDTDNSQEDKGLDLLIDHLVKPRLAAVEVQEVKKDHYIYQLEPDWTAVSTFLTQRQADLQPEIADWLAACRRDFPASPICGTLGTRSDKSNLLRAGSNGHGPQIQKG